MVLLALTVVVGALTVVPPFGQGEMARRAVTDLGWEVGAASGGMSWT